MADPVVHITAGIPDSGTGNITTLGQVMMGGVPISDGSTNIVAVKAASTAAVVGDKALVVAISPNGQLAPGSALPANASPVVVAPQVTRVAVVPSVTASAYSAGNVIGGVMSFLNMVPSIGQSGILKSIAVKFKATVVTGNIDVVVFANSPNSGTYTDKTAPTSNAADVVKLIGIYTLSSPSSKLGTMTAYNLDKIDAAFVAASTTLYAIAVVAGTPTPASTTDMVVELAVLPA